MMPTAWFIIAAFVSTVLAAIGLWSSIREWCQESLFPFLEQYMPALMPDIRTAFFALDDAVVSVRRTIKQAWLKLRQTLLHQVVLLKRQTSSHWVRIVTSWVIRRLQNAAPVPVKIVAEILSSWDDLPAEVRARNICVGENLREIPVTTLRDDEMLKNEC